jgi:hypothetical protein
MILTSHAKGNLSAPEERTLYQFGPNGPPDRRRMPALYHALKETQEKISTHCVQYWCIQAAFKSSNALEGSNVSTLLEQW